MLMLALTLNANVSHSHIASCRALLPLHRSSLFVSHCPYGRKQVSTPSSMAVHSSKTCETVYFILNSSIFHVSFIPFDVVSPH